MPGHLDGEDPSEAPAEPKTRGVVYPADGDKTEDYQLEYALKYIRNGMKPLGIEQKKVAASDVPPESPVPPTAAPATPAPK